MEEAPHSTCEVSSELVYGYGLTIPDGWEIVRFGFPNVSEYYIASPDRKIRQLPDRTGLKCPHFVVRNKAKAKHRWEHLDRKWMKLLKRQLQLNKEMREKGIPDLRLPDARRLPA